MSDVSQVNLKEPEQTDWDNYNPGGKYVAPPPAVGPDGKFIVYNGQVPGKIDLDVTPEGYRSFLLDPIKLVKSGPADGYELRFTRVNVKKFLNKKTNEPGNMSSAGNFIKACGITAKPQSNKEWEAAVGLTKGRIFPLTLDWVAKNKDTGEEVRGYENFPIEIDANGVPTGRRKSILHQGDVLPNGQTVQSEVLFANARLRFFEFGGKK